MAYIPVRIKEENEDPMAIKKENPEDEPFWDPFQSSVKKEIPLLVLYDLAEQMNQVHSVENTTHVHELGDSNDVEELDHLSDSEESEHFIEGEESELSRDAEESDHLSDTEESDHISDVEESGQLQDAEESENLSDAEESVHLSDAEESVHLSGAGESEHLSDAEESEHVRDAEESVHFSDAEDSEHFMDAEESVHLRDAKELDDSRDVEDAEDFDVQEPGHCSPVTEPENLSHVQDQEDPKPFHDPKNTANYTGSPSTGPELETQKPKEGYKKKQVQNAQGHRNRTTKSTTVKNIQKKEKKKTVDLEPIRKSDRKSKKNVVFFDSFITYTSEMFETGHVPWTLEKRLSAANCQIKTEPENGEIVKGKPAAIPTHNQKSKNRKTVKVAQATAAAFNQKSENKINDKSVVVSSSQKQKPRKRNRGRGKPEVVPNQDVRPEEKKKKRVKLEDIPVNNQATAFALKQKSVKKISDKGVVVSSGPKQKLRVRTKGKGKPKVVPIHDVRLEEKKKKGIKFEDIRMNDQAAASALKQKSVKKVNDKRVAISSGPKQNSKKRKRGKENAEVVPIQNVRFEKKKGVKLEDIPMDDQATASAFKQMPVKNINDKGVAISSGKKTNSKKRKRGKQNIEVMPINDIRPEEKKEMEVKLEDIPVNNQKPKKKRKVGESLPGIPIGDPNPTKRKRKKEKLKVKLGKKKQPTKIKEEALSIPSISKQGGERMVNNVLKKPRLKTWFCEYCHESFSGIYYLKLHTMHHTNERPFKCDICNKGFRMRWRVKLHRMTHSNEKPFHCEFCNFCCNRRDNLFGHMRRVHQKHSETFDASHLCKTNVKSEKKV